MTPDEKEGFRIQSDILEWVLVHTKAKDRPDVGLLLKRLDEARALVLLNEERT